MSVVVAVEVHARTDVLKGIPGQIELAGGAVRPDAAMPRGGAELAERCTGNKVVRNDDMTLSGGVEIDRAILIGAIGTSREEDAVLDGDIGGGVDAHANELRAAVGGIEDLDAIDRHRADGADRRGALYDRLGTTGGGSGDAGVRAEDRDGFVDRQAFGVGPCIHHDRVAVGSSDDHSLNRLPVLACQIVIRSLLIVYSLKAGVIGLPSGGCRRGYSLLSSAAPPSGLVTLRQTFVFAAHELL